LKLDLGSDVIVVSKPVIEQGPSWWEVFRSALAEWWEKSIFVIKGSYIYVAGFSVLIIIPAIIGLRKKFG
jgi:hypothetical protein